MMLRRASRSLVGPAPCGAGLWNGSRVIPATTSRRSISNIQLAKKHKTKLLAQKPKWTPPFPGWKPDPETEISKHKNIRKKAKLHLVFPDVLAEPFTPYFMLKVEYSPETIVRKGHYLPPAKVQIRPSVSGWPSDPNKRWTLVMTTPDDPELVPDHAEIKKPGWVVPHTPESRGKEVLHWMITNIPGSDVSRGTVVCDYLPPMPKKHAGGHRYVFLLFEQADGETNFDKLGQFTTLDDRRGWNTGRVLEQYGLKPKGMAFFKATWAAEVSSLYESLDRNEPAGPAPEHPQRYQKWLDASLWHERL